MAKETYYFSHDSNALTDTKILNMRADYGLEGYGLFWVIIEMMRNEENYKLDLSKNTYRAIKTLTNTSIDVEKFINDCIDDYQVFEKQGEKFYSNSFLKRMEQKDKKSAIAKEKAEKRWNSNAIAMQQQCSSNANKRKENKRKENKEKENKEKENKTEEIEEREEEKFIPPTLEEIQEYIQEKKLKVDAKQFYDYFTEGKWIDSNGNTVKSWKQKILTWNNYSVKEKEEKKQSFNNYEQREYDNLDQFLANKI